MSQLFLLKEPGYIYDLFFIFYLRFNTEHCIEVIDDNDRRSEDIKFFDNLLDLFSDISDDLFVFFHAIENGRSFMTTHYFNTYKELFATTFDFKFLQGELLDRDKLTRNLISFYFPELSEEETERCMNSNVELFVYIKNSKYSGEEKSKLYEFFINPEPYFQNLQYELMGKEIILAQYYEKNYQKILSVYNMTTFKILNEQVKGFKDLSFIEKNNQKLYVSYCLLNKYCINFFGIEEGALYLLGYEYLSVIECINDINKELNLLDFGSALSEGSRVSILYLLLERGELTCKDLEKVFNFSGSTAYHHITMMMKAGLVKTRNEGKTIFYSINRKYFDAVIGVLSKFSTRL